MYLATNYQTISDLKNRLDEFEPDQKHDKYLIADLLWTTRNPSFSCSCDKTRFQELTGMKILPERITLDQILEPRVKCGGMKEHMLDNFCDEEMFLGLHPARTKTDLVIRRTRWQDIRYSVTEDMVNLMRDVSLDYIHTLNLYYYMLVHEKGLYVLSRIKQNGGLCSIENWIEVTTQINSRAKTYHTDPDDLILTAELSGLTGYRNPPMPGFDVVAEVKDLANAGTSRPQAWHGLFKKALEKVLNIRSDFIEWQELVDFIPSVATSGASGEKGEFMIDNIMEKIAIRKNMLPYFKTVDQLVKSQPAYKQIAKAFVKPELGKLRIAVTSDYNTYLLQSYLLYFVNHAYLKIDGITLEESGIVELKRHEHMLKLLRNCYALPFDYRAFDHQPTMDEIKEITSGLLRLGLINVPEEKQDQIEAWIEVCVNSFTQSVIIIDGVEYNVKGGVMSGIRLTSLLGNLWNRIVMEVVSEFAPPIYLEVRGDDSNIIDPNWYSLLVIRLLMTSYNIDGSNSKFSIHSGRTEFLRLWYVDRVQGLPNRVIPGLTQNKPWSNTPWHAESIIESLLSCYYTLRRRVGKKLQNIRTIVVNAWCRIRKVSWKWLQLPRIMGGLGMLPYEGYSTTVNWIRPKAWRPSIRTKYTPTPPWVHDLQAKGFTFSADQCVKASLQYFSSLLSYDDAREVARRQRDYYTSELVKWRETIKTIKWQYVPVNTHSLSQGREEEGYSSVSVAYSDIVKNPPSLFGKYRDKLELWRNLIKYKDFDRTFRPMQYIRLHEAGLYYAIKKLERLGYHRTFAVDYVMEGKMGMSDCGLHPLATVFVESMAARLFQNIPKINSFYNRVSRFNEMIVVSVRAAARRVGCSPWYKALLDRW